jgi:succinate dehydrogenase/fumarate reductase cytochrome b subunit
MKETTPAIVIRHFHRWSGLLLILLVGAKLLSGFRLAGVIPFPAETAANRLHFSRWVDIPLVFCFVFHSTYGILKVLMSGGVKKKGRAFVIANAVALAVFALCVLFVF